jgi:hypothetical protein
MSVGSTYMGNPTSNGTRPKVRKLLATGHTPRDIALILGITTQRVYQIMEDLKAASKEQAS